jgi:hypothetical protein
MAANRREDQQHLVQSKRTSITIFAHAWGTAGQAHGGGCRFGWGALKSPLTNLGSKVPDTRTKPKRPWGGQAVRLALASVSGLAMLVMAPSTDRARASGVVEPVADAYVTAHHPRTRHGADPTLRMRGTPVTTSYLRFGLPDEDAQVTGATLRLYARMSSPGVRVRAVGDDAWSEQTIDAKTAPPLGQVVARSARL